MFFAVSPGYEIQDTRVKAACLVVSYETFLVINQAIKFHAFVTSKKISYTDMLIWKKPQIIFLTFQGK